MRTRCSSRRSSASGRRSDTAAEADVANAVKAHVYGGALHALEPGAHRGRGALPSGQRHAGRMERLERLVVHIEEALRQGREKGEPQLRLALLLLDSAAELILHRAVQAKLTWQHVDAQMLAALDRAQAQGAQLSDEDRARQAELRKKVLSKSQRRTLKRNFDAKAEYLVAQGDLPVATARALRKVHEYRNEAHHRDTVRAGSLRSAVDIYSYLVCTLLRDLNTMGPMVALGVPAGLRRYLGESPWPDFRRS